MISEGKSTGINILNEKYNNGWTPLHSASYHGHLEVVELLISEAKSMGVDILNEKDNYGRSPLHSASRNGRVKVVELLISYGADYSEIMEEYENEENEERREELERIVIEVGMGKVKMI